MVQLDAVDRRIINDLQGGFPLCERPFAAVAERLGLAEDELLYRLDALLQQNVLSRFGPLWNAERIGGAVTLAAMRVADGDVDYVVPILNSLPQVAHNYERDHAFNLWFVLATETPAEIPACIVAIERKTGYRVFNFPKQEEYFLDLRLKV